jgi:hypothetical protein
MTDPSDLSPGAITAFAKVFREHGKAAMLGMAHPEDNPFWDMIEEELDELAACIADQILKSRATVH